MHHQNFDTTRHFIYVMTSSDPAPASGGDTGSWFRYYKWDVEGEAFVPFPPETLENSPLPAEGDTLWFVLDGACLGCAPVVRADSANMQGVVEVYYNAQCRRELVGVSLAIPLVTGVTTPETVSRLTHG